LKTDTKVDNEIDVNAFTRGESFNIIKTVTDVIFNNEGLKTNIINCDTKVENEIDVNAFTGGETFNIEDSIKTVTDVICNNEGLKTNIINCDIKVENEIAINTYIGGESFNIEDSIKTVTDSIGDESSNIGHFLNTSMDVLNNTKCMDTIIIDLGTKAGKEIDASMNIEFSTFASVACSNESVVTNIESLCSINVGNEIGVNTPISNVVFNHGALHFKQYF
ncbi:27480_t:CDS:2, partial [Racocetra persica]